MKNKEKYFDEIIESFTSSEYNMCNFKKDHILGLKSCSRIKCAECYQRTKEWLEQEYQELIELTEDEKVILKNLSKRYEWIARNKGGRMCLYFRKPQKSDADPWWQSAGPQFYFSMYDEEGSYYR